jgi:hypothetical protein
MTTNSSGSGSCKRGVARLHPLLPLLLSYVLLVCGIGLFFVLVSVVEGMYTPQILVMHSFAVTQCGCLHMHTADVLASAADSGHLTCPSARHACIQKRSHITCIQLLLTKPVSYTCSSVHLLVHDCVCSVLEGEKGLVFNIQAKDTDTGFRTGHC